MTRLQLEEKNIVFHHQENLYTVVYRKNGSPGNHIEGFRSSPIVSVNENMETVEEMVFDAPVLYIREPFEAPFFLTQWRWVPGPGPGDFELRFDTEAALYAFIDSYHFSANAYFDALKTDYENREKN